MQVNNRIYQILERVTLLVPWDIADLKNTLQQSQVTELRKLGLELGQLIKAEGADLGVNGDAWNVWATSWSWHLNQAVQKMKTYNEEVINKGKIMQATSFFQQVKGFASYSLTVLEFAKNATTASTVIVDTQTPSAMTMSMTTPATPSSSCISNNASVLCAATGLRDALQSLELVDGSGASSNYTFLEVRDAMYTFSRTVRTANTEDAAAIEDTRVMVEEIGTLAEGFATQLTSESDAVTFTDVSAFHDPPEGAIIHGQSHYPGI